MSNKTWFKLYRGWQENPMFRSDKDKLCWLWLIENAVIDQVTISINNRPEKIERGQLCYSISFLAKAWGATPSYVRCFLKHLKLWQAIDTRNDKGQTLITICNYSKYQDKGLDNDKGSCQNAARQRQGDDNNTKNDKEYKNKDIIIDRPNDVSETTWQDWIKLRKKKKAVISENVINGIRKKSNSIGMSLDRAMQIIVERNWQGFEISWIDESEIKRQRMRDGYQGM